MRENSFRISSNLLVGGTWKENRLKLSHKQNEWRNLDVQIFSLQMVLSTFGHFSSDVTELIEVSETDTLQVIHMLQEEEEFIFCQRFFCECTSMYVEI